MKLHLKAKVVLAGICIGMLAWSCSEVAAPPRQAPGSYNASTNSIDPPPDDCSADPMGYGCPRTLADGGTGTGCPRQISGCVVYTIHAADPYGNAVQQALQHINFGDQQCVNLANYAIQRLNSNLMSYYVDNNGAQFGDYGDSHYFRGYGFDPWAKIDISTYTFSLNNSGGQLTKTLIHEAWHGYYGSGDDDTAETIARGCYR